MAIEPVIEAAVLLANGRVPNNPLPALIYRQAIDTQSADDSAARIEQVFARNGWLNSWTNGIYPFHHYHSISHEVLGIAIGRVYVRLGGDQGQDFTLDEGDIVVLPAGVGHKRLSASRDLLVVGAYPDGRDWDLIRADDTGTADYEAARSRIAAVPLPEADPVFGAQGPLLQKWRTR
jgi:uncharacterized protein YjlB